MTDEAQQREGEQPQESAPMHWLHEVESVIHEDTAAALRVLMRVVHEIEQRVGL